MKKWLLWTSLGTLSIALAMHFITLTVIPLNIMNKTMEKYPVNQLMKGRQTDAQSRGVVRPSPDLVYSIVSYDVSKEPIQLTARVPTDTYWSVSMFQENTDNFFVMNDRQVKSNPVVIILAKEGTEVSDAANAQIVYSPTSRGILLIRHLLQSDDKYQDLLNIQKESYLKIGIGSDTASPTPASSNAEYTNSTYGFTIKYPAIWKEGPISGKQLFYAAASLKVPALSISCRDEISFKDALNAALLDSGNSDITISPEKDVTLIDGTPARQSELKFMLKAGYKADALALGVNKDGKWILSIITTVSAAAPYNEQEFASILQSMQFKK